MLAPVVSADSHVTEPPGTYVERIDRRFRDRAPRLVRDDRRGDIFVIEGLDRPVPMGLVAAARQPAAELQTFGARFEDLHRGGWDPDARLADQERDGVAAEILYPTVGMLLCNHPDFDYKKACFDAYNLWLAEFAGAHPDRLVGIGQTALRSVGEGIEDLRRMRDLGLRGAMLPGNPAVADYHDPVYDPFWEAAVDLAMPLSFHILTSAQDGFKTRGPKLNAFLSIIRGCQDILGMLVLGGVFERHPRLRVVCAEADAGWVPHYMYRMDHAYDRHRYWLPAGTLRRPPSEYFRDNVYTTFQDDRVAFQLKDLCNIRRLLWASDFPHSDSTWPNSRAVLAEHTAHMTDAERNLVVHDNAAELYRLTV
jgi:predicted TIM-barrel fold metal-dependent hydrolase